MSREYPQTSPTDIDAVGAHDPQRAALMALGNAISSQATSQASNPAHTPQLQSSGWKITVDTPQGALGLWSCWLGNQFYLGYPHHLSAPDDLIQATLQVTSARPVADHQHGQRQWARFYGPQLPNQQGRVWVDHKDFHSSSHSFRRIASGELLETQYGHDASQGIFTAQFSHYGPDRPEAPNAEPEVIQPYRNRFLELLGQLADHFDDATGITLDYGFVLVPEQLPAIGCDNIRWLKGRPGEHQGWGNDLVSATRTTAYGTETIMLESANQIVPWVNLRHVPWSGPLTSQHLQQLLMF